MDNIKLIDGAKNGDFKSIARLLTLVENDALQSFDILTSIQPNQKTPVIGITGPPGAGKSTLVNAIMNQLVAEGKKIAVLAVDPTSPFNLGSLLGDRIRMAQQFNNPNVYIRSVATRGSLGGISSKALEMTDVLKSSNFDVIFIETVGVGQSEIEIAGLADKTILVLVPEAGDEIQNIKSGIMEIAQVFVVNKADRDGADLFYNNLRKFLKEQHQQIPVFKTVADKNLGVDLVCTWINSYQPPNKERKKVLMTESIYKIIQAKKMIGVNKKDIFNLLTQHIESPNFNLHKLAAMFIEKNTNV